MQVPSCDHPLCSGVITLQPLALYVRRIRAARNPPFVRKRPKEPKASLDIVDAFRYVSLRSTIRIFQARNEGATFFACVQPVIKRRSHVPNMG